MKTFWGPRRYVGMWPWVRWSFLGTGAIGDDRRSNVNASTRGNDETRNARVTS